MNLAEFIEDHHEQHLAELCEFLRIPSVSAKSEHKPDIERAAGWVSEKLRAAGFKKVRLEYKLNRVVAAIRNQCCKFLMQMVGINPEFLDSHL